MTDVASQPPPAAYPWHRRMVARGRNEPHRASTPLELLFDLCFVVAVSQAAAQLHHGLAEAHVGPAVLGYLLVFFAIWWAWMNFPWFASAYDPTTCRTGCSAWCRSLAGWCWRLESLPRSWPTTSPR